VTRLPNKAAADERGWPGHRDQGQASCAPRSRSPVWADTLGSETMQGESDRRNRLTRIIRWTARGWAVATVGVVLLLCMVEGLYPARPTEWIGLLLYPGGVCVGMILAWWREGLGGLEVDELRARVPEPGRRYFIRPDRRLQTPSEPQKSSSQPPAMPDPARTSAWPRRVGTGRLRPGGDRAALPSDPERSYRLDDLEEAQVTDRPSSLIRVPRDRCSSRRGIRH